MACVAALRAPDIQIVIPAMVLAEATYLVGSRMGAAAESAFLRGMRCFRLEAPRPDDLVRMADLVGRYASFPLGGTDASVVALAERLGTDLVITLDHRHMRAVVPKHCPALRLLPE